MGEVFTLIVPQKIISSFNNQLDLVVMLELGVDILFLLPKQSQATCTDVNIYCNFMLLDYVTIGRDILFS